MHYSSKIWRYKPAGQREAKFSSPFALGRKIGTHGGRPCPEKRTSAKIPWVIYRMNRTRLCLVWTRYVSNGGVSIGSPAAGERLSHNIARRWFCCGLAMGWRGAACDALVVLCWALAKLREAQALPLQVFRARQSQVARHTRDRSPPGFYRLVKKCMMPGWRTVTDCTNLLSPITIQIIHSVF
jgi:hypothetical protein